MKSIRVCLWPLLSVVAMLALAGTSKASSNYYCSNVVVETATTTYTMSVVTEISGSVTVGDLNDGTDRGRASGSGSGFPITVTDSAESTTISFDMPQPSGYGYPAYGLGTSVIVNGTSVPITYSEEWCISI
jgi:hypothetical protein